MDVLERVGSSRMMLEGKFPYPSAVDCMRYAVQELAEYDDAMMRLDQPDHKRNNERQPDPRKELGQAGFMILSAILLFANDEGRPGCMTIADGPSTALWAYAAMNISSAICYCHAEEMESAAIDIWYAWATVEKMMTWHGWDVDDLIAETCEAFEAKHLGVSA